MAGGLLVRFGPDLRFALQHREGVWEVEDAEGGLTENAEADAKRWEQIDAHFRQGLDRMEAGDLEAAARAFEAVLAVDPGVVDARVNLGFCQLGLGSSHEAMVSFELAIGLRPEQANAYYGLALVLHDLDDIAGAVGHMRTYVHLAGEGAPFQEKAMAYLSKWEDELRVLRAGGEPVPD